MSRWVLTLAAVHSVTPITRGNEEFDKHALSQSSLLSLKPREHPHLLTAVSQMHACPHPVLSAQEDRIQCASDTHSASPPQSLAYKYLLNVAQLMSDLHVEAPNKCTKNCTSGHMCVHVHFVCVYTCPMKAKSKY